MITQSSLPEIKLDNCPFCTGEAILMTLSMIYVKCKTCGASSQMFRKPEDNGDVKFFQLYYETKLQAASYWNRRNKLVEVECDE